MWPLWLLKCSSALLLTVSSGVGVWAPLTGLASVHTTRGQYMLAFANCLAASMLTTMAMVHLLPEALTLHTTDVALTHAHTAHTHDNSSSNSSSNAAAEHAAVLRTLTWALVGVLVPAMLDHAISSSAAAAAAGGGHGGHGHSHGTHRHRHTHAHDTAHSSQHHHHHHGRADAVTQLQQDAGACVRASYDSTSSIDAASMPSLSSSSASSPTTMTSMSPQSSTTLAAATTSTTAAAATTTTATMATPAVQPPPPPPPSAATHMTTTLVLLLLMCFHNVLEGLVLGLERSAASLMNTLLPLLAHKFFDGVVVGVSLAKQRQLSSSSQHTATTTAAASPLSRGAHEGTRSGNKGDGSVTAAQSETTPLLPPLHVQQQQHTGVSTATTTTSAAQQQQHKDSSTACATATTTAANDRNSRNSDNDDSSMWTWWIAVWLLLTPLTLLLTARVYHGGDNAPRDDATAHAHTTGPLTATWYGTPVLSAVQAAASGSFLYVGLSLLMQEETKRARNVVAIVLGAVATYSLTVTEHHGHLGDGQ